MVHTQQSWGSGCPYMPNMTPGSGGEGVIILEQALWPVVSGLPVSQCISEWAYVLAMTFS